jgi:hypothetical protein
VRASTTVRPSTVRGALAPSQKSSRTIRSCAGEPVCGSVACGTIVTGWVTAVDAVGLSLPSDVRSRAKPAVGGCRSVTTTFRVADATTAPPISACSCTAYTAACG